MDRMLAFLVKLVLVSHIIIGVANANFVFNVQHKFGGRNGGFSTLGRSALKTLKAHDAQRHGRMLSAVDFELGGNGVTTGTGMHYAKLSIGTPPKDYFVSVDTGSNDLWLNCAGCDMCPKKTDLGFNLTAYDVKSSSTGKTVSCDDSFCSLVANKSACKTGGQCEFSVGYADGDKMLGHYVRDSFNFDKISGDLKTSSMDGGNIAFGCSTKGNKNSEVRALDGLIGFGQGKTSVLNQLASSGKTKRIFSHCLESVKRGGIFAIGEVVEPKVQTTPIVPGKVHYNVYLERIEVGGVAVWNDQAEVAKGGMPNTKSEKTVAIIDSGATLADFPGEVYDAVLPKIMEKHTGLNTYMIDSQTKCFNYYNNNIDADFPVVSLHFENSATLNIYPHDYLYKWRQNEFCFTLVKTSPHLVLNGKQIFLLGSVVLSDKLIVYDLENMTMGFTEYNCSSSIKVKDESSGNFYSVSAHDISVSSARYYRT